MSRTSLTQLIRMGATEEQIASFKKRQCIRQERKRQQWLIRAELQKKNAIITAQNILELQKIKAQQKGKPKEEKIKPIFKSWKVRKHCWVRPGGEPNSSTTSFWNKWFDPNTRNNDPDPKEDYLEHGRIAR
jgi:hypothetical protein